MFLVARQRCKESLKSEDLAKVNRLLDDGIIPAMEKIEGVKSVRAYDSIRGDVVILVEIEELAAIDRALVDQEFNQIASGMFESMVRTEGGYWI